MGQKFKSLFIANLTKFFAIQIPTIILAIISFFGVPSFFISRSPLFLFRYLISLTYKWIRPDLAEMVTPLGALFAIDNVYTQPKFNIVIRLLLEGKVDLDKLRDLVNRSLVNARLPNGEVQYPELKQELVHWMGFPFWKNDSKFDIKNHVTLHNEDSDEIVSDTEINDILKYLAQKPSGKGQALWEIVLVHNCQLKGFGGEQSVLFLRIHHCLADGHSYTALINQGLAQLPNPRFAEPKYYQRNNILNTVLFAIAFPFRSAYESAESFINLLCPWIKAPFLTSDRAKSGQHVFGISERINIQRVKEICKYFGVSFSTVVSAVVTGAVREIMIRKNMEIPEILEMMSPMPVPGHPPQLRNHFTAAVKKMPVGEQDPVKRLVHCGQDDIRQKASSLILYNQYCLPIAGALFPFEIRFFQRIFVASTYLSMGSFGNDYIFINGHKCLDLTPMVGAPPGNMAFLVGGGGYGDFLRINISTDAAIMSEEEVSDLSNLFGKELDILYKKMN